MTSMHWDIDNWDVDSVRKVDTEAASELASHFGDTSDLVSSKQRALELVLDSLDAAKFDTAVIMPVVAPEWVLSAVLRSRCQPILIDSGAASLSMNRAVLKEALEDLGKFPCVVLHYSPFGDVIHEEALALTKDHVTVTISPDLPGRHCPTTFAIHDMCPAMNRGAMLTTNYTDMHSMVRAAIVRSGDYVSPYEATIGAKYLPKMSSRSLAISEVAKVYEIECKHRGILACLPASEIVRYYPIMVDNAAFTEAKLKGGGMDAKTELYSLAQLPYVKAIVTKEFPNAAARHNHVLSLPTNITPGLAVMIMKMVKEVEDRTR